MKNLRSGFISIDRCTPLTIQCRPFLFAYRAKMAIIVHNEGLREIFQYSSYVFRCHETKQIRYFRRVCCDL